MCRCSHCTANTTTHKEKEREKKKREKRERERERERGRISERKESLPEKCLLCPKDLHSGGRVFG